MRKGFLRILHGRESLRPLNENIDMSEFPKLSVDNEFHFFKEENLKHNSALQCHLYELMIQCFNLPGSE